MSIALQHFAELLEKGTLREKLKVLVGEIFSRCHLKFIKGTNI